MFDERKDKTMACLSCAGIEVKASSYNGGETKIQITRFEQKTGTRIYGKLGRVTVAEAVAIQDMLTAVIAQARSSEVAVTNVASVVR